MALSVLPLLIKNKYISLCRQFGIIVFIDNESQNHYH